MHNYQTPSLRSFLVCELEQENDAAARCEYLLENPKSTAALDLLGYADEALAPPASRLSACWATPSWRHVLGQQRVGLLLPLRGPDLAHGRRALPVGRVEPHDHFGSSPESEQSLHAW